MPAAASVPLLPFPDSPPVLEPQEPAANREDGIEERFDVPFVARLALKEKQIQQNVRPVISVHKWFARRPGTLFRALLLAELGEAPLREAFVRPHRFDGVRVADPFMGGGSPLLEANRLGCDVVGWDVNPMAWWVVRQEMAYLDLEAYVTAAEAVENALQEQIGEAYQTRCRICSAEAPVKYFLWVKTTECPACEHTFDLFPGYLVAADQRHPRNVLICPSCGELEEVEDRKRPGTCSSCGDDLQLDGPAKRSRCACPRCGEECSYQNPQVPPRQRMVALEYHCPECRPTYRGRFFKKPDAQDLKRHAEAERRLAAIDTRFVPDEDIPKGDETARLHRWGYQKYRDLFNPRQLLGLELLAREISGTEDLRLREALATNFSDLLRYQNMLCRYDTRALKSLDVFSVHGFPVGLVRCESNLLGIRTGPWGRHASNVGSGGWSNIVTKFLNAKQYCEEPFEHTYRGGRRRRVSVPGEWIGDARNGDHRQVELHCGTATTAELPPNSVDAVLTDPPYFANVQYAELMDFCHVWLRRLVGSDLPAFHEKGAHRDGDLTGNETLDRGLEHFAAGLSEVFCRMAGALKPGRPLVFTYHHNELEAYRPVVAALLDAGLSCTRVLPCPAEMGGSIHIHKTESSIVDSVFVCRQMEDAQSPADASILPELLERISTDLEDLRQGSLEPSMGDTRCITYGHLARLAIARLQSYWDPDASCEEKLERVQETFLELPSWEVVRERLDLQTDVA